MHWLRNPIAIAWKSLCKCRTIDTHRLRNPFSIAKRCNRGTIAA
jgi:hypothetical protein